MRTVPKVCLALSISILAMGNVPMEPLHAQEIPLPRPMLDGAISLERALERRRSVRELGGAPLELADLGQLLWAAQGVTETHGYRTAPSAGALYPLEIYALVADVGALRPGVYRYEPSAHALIMTRSGDRRRSLAAAALDQEFVGRTPVVLVIAAVYARTEARYGSRADRHVHMEAGHAAQNIYLQATARDLATVLVGAFDDRAVQTAVGLPSDHIPLGLMPVGRRE
jgi:SagB-type dehydrogenase family enzyme